MVAKYFVWGEGVWRELDVAAGRVAGWRRRARFVFVRRGRLLVARRRAVLRALAALAAGQPSAAADGPRLEHRRKSVTSHKKDELPPPAAVPAPPAPPPAPCQHLHCCTHFNGYSATAPAHRREAGTQCGTRAPPSLTISVDRAPRAPAAPATPAARPYSSADEFVSTPARPARTGTCDVSALLGARPPPPPSAAANNKRAPLDSSDDEPLKRSKRPRAATTSSSSAESSTARARRGTRAVCKELIISEAHVAALRGFVARTRPSALARFDADDAYKRALFYAINPLVELERCARLERMLAQRHALQLPEFAERLGLAPSAPAPRPRPAPRRRPSAEADTDKENKDKYSSPNKVSCEAISALKSSPEKRARAAERRNKREKVAAVKASAMNGDVGATVRGRASAHSGAAPGSAPAGTHVISKRASATGAKEYSNLEDHAIVAWVSVGARASLVKGNRVWRELQEQYARLTGHARSWHSLRNRYLRYILPALAALRLPPAQESRLRAAAAAGAIASRARSAAGLASADVRRNSMFEDAPLGAASRRMRAATAEPDDDTDGRGDTQPQQKRIEDSSSEDAAHAHTLARRARSPRYSEVTRRYAARHRTPPTSSGPASPARPPSPVLTAVTRSRKLFNPNANV